jgi:hypothetical protein
MSTSYWFGTAAVLVGLAGLASADGPERKAYLERRAQEKAAAEKTVAHLTKQDFGKLSAGDFVRLALAYNELGDNPAALDAINRAPESYLAKHGRLDLKAVCLHNVNSSGTDRAGLLRELAFYDRCIDRHYGNVGLWHWRKASLLCRASVSVDLPRGALARPGPRVVDREQYEYAYETLERAFKAEPGLLRLGTVGVEDFWASDFPLLSSEARFKKLMGK